MKGWLFTGTHIPFKLVEKPDPVAVPGEVVIDIKSAGLCHSDVAALEDPGWMAIFTNGSVYMGHEFAGVITEVGAGVTGFKVGDRVGVCPMNLDYPKPGGVGYARDGGYATKALVPAEQLVLLPDNVNFAQGAAGTDAGGTAYRAMFVTGGAKAGMKVGVIGIGGLGQLAARMAVLAGCEVYAAEVKAEARELGKEIGVKQVFENVSDLAAVGCELIVDYAGFGTTTAQALEAVAYSGTVVLAGMGKLEANINTYSLITNSLTLKGSVGMKPDDIKAVYDFFATGKLNPELTTITFDEIPDGLERLHRGEVKGRLVALI